MYKRIYILVILLSGLWMTGCEEQIDIDLEEGQQEVVIEGWVTTANEPYVFKVTRSMNFFGDPEEIPISGAQLVVKDDMGVVDTLEEVQPGHYQTGHLIGQTEHNYSLEAEVEGQSYTADNYLPRIGPVVALFSQYSDTIIFGEGHYVFLVAQEPPGIGDYYQFRVSLNDSLFDGVGDILVTDDRFVDGQLSPFMYPYPFESGDTVSVEIRAISNLSYDYYITYFQQATGGGSPFGSPPANLITNISNPGLGFFGTAALVRDTIIIP